MEHPGEITRGLRLVSSGLRRMIERSTSQRISQGLRISRALFGWLERMGHRSPITEEELIAELARVLADPDSARLVVRQAGLPAGLLPAFRMPITYWTAVVEAARNGAIEGGVLALAEAAAHHWPGNETFAGYRSLPP